MTKQNAATLFGFYIAAQDRGEPADVDELCRENPECADSLRRLVDLHERMRAAFGGATESLSAGTLRSHWADYLSRLARIGPPPSRYARGQELNSGGMGSIHVVSDTLLERRLAVKLMKAAGLPVAAGTPRSDDRSLGRFLEEAKVTAKLDHPYIVPVHDIGLDESGQVYFAMKEVRGEDLRSVFEKVAIGVDGWTLTRGIAVIVKVCEAMSYAHEKGVVHRDLKPGNVMVGSHGEVYVMDWGLARILEEADFKDIRLRETAESDASDGSEGNSGRRSSESPEEPLVTMDGDVLGTPAYMPLEQAQGDTASVRERSDVYAVGAMLYHLVSGAMPYAEAGGPASAMQILRRVRTGPPRPLHELAPDAPSELIAIIEKSMARSSGDRYPTMAALRSDLQAFLDLRVVTAYETGALAELRKWIRRNPALSSAAAALVGVLAVSSAIVAKKNEDLVDANVEIGAQKAAVEARREEVERRKSEFDQLAGVVLLETANSTEASLHPPWPEQIPMIELWLVENAGPLVAMRSTVARTIEDLEKRALSWTEEERDVDRATHPRIEELGALRHRLAWFRARAEALGSATTAPPPELPPRLRELSALLLNDFAWRRVQSDLTKRLFGEEPLALAAALEAVRRVDAGDPTASRSGVLDTLAWAQFANGNDPAAREASDRAHAAAPPAERSAYEGIRNSLEVAITRCSGDSLNHEIATLTSALDALELEVNARRTWTFSTQSERFLHSTLKGLAIDLEEFDTRVRTGVEQRLAWARRIRELTLRHPLSHVTWEEARRSIGLADGVVASRDYSYRPIDLAPQMGLVPIGMNPVTGYWEFYDLRSGCDYARGQDPATIEIPRHDAAGALPLRDGDGIVFVLLPGGTTTLGAQNTDENGPNFEVDAKADERVQVVVLDPFLLARDEMTSGQWKRLTGETPSWHLFDRLYENDPFPIGWTHPVTQVSWDDANTWLSRHGMILPTEAQWEYGARGGSASSWWIGGEPGEIVRAGNVLDVRAAARYPTWGVAIGDFDDGFVSLAPVGRFEANAFGLFDVIGNVWEHCADAYFVNYGEPRAGDGMRFGDSATPLTRVFRGGSFNHSASDARSAYRNRMNPTIRAHHIGLRAARRLLDRFE